MNSIRFGYVGFGLLAAASVVVVACGDDGATASGSGSGGAAASSGGASPGAGGAAAGGAAPGAGGAAPGAGGAAPGAGGAAQGNGGGQPVTRDDISITGTITQCTGTTAPVLPDITATTCTAVGCSAATCVDKALVQQFAPTTDLTLVGTCNSPDVLCLPNDFIATGGDFLAKKCVSLNNAEGRCISKCIPRVAVQQNNLPKDTCADSEVCAPCVDPIDGSNTTACDQGCDTGTSQTPPVVFDRCGADKGVCVPEALVPADLKDAVPVDTCTGQGELCAPIEKAKDISYKFTQCTSADPLLVQTVTVPNSEGWLFACVPTYIVPEAQRSLLKQETCQVGDMCAPCFNPLMNQAATGACVP